MKNKKNIIIAISALLVGCTSLGTQKTLEKKSETDDKPVVCYERSVDPFLVLKKTPLDTGVLRDKPIDIISRNIFIEKLKRSPLWKQIEHQYEERAGFKMNRLNGYLSISLDNSGLNSANIQKIYYSPIDYRKRNKYGHQLLNQEKFGMTEAINLVIDDHGKATEILEQLYQQYLVKVENNDVLSDGETLHTYIRYEGKLFELWGINRNTHPIEECNFSMLKTLIID